MINKIVIKNQQELDLIPEHCDILITIDFGTESAPAIIKSNHKYVVWDKKVEIRSNCTLKAYGSSIVIANKLCKVFAYENSLVYAYDFSRVYMHNNSHAIACDNSTVFCCDSSSSEGYDNCLLVGKDKAQLLGKNKTVCLIDNFCSAESDDESFVVAKGNTQVIKSSKASSVQLFENARVFV